MYMQERVARAIKVFLDSTSRKQPGCISSCIAFTLVETELDTNDLVKAYREFSNCRTNDFGFHHIPLADWGSMSLEQKYTYRLEMMYYFWLANQDM